MNSFHLTIQTPRETLWQGEADIVALTTEQGEMEIYPGHAPLIGAIDFSRVNVKHEKQEEQFVVRLGLVFVETEFNRVRIVAQFGEKHTHVDHKSVKEYLDFILEKLANHETLNAFQIKHLEAERTSLEKMIEVVKAEK